MRRLVRVLRWVLIFSLLGALAGWIVIIWAPFPEAALDRHPTESQRLLDRHGQPLREILGPAGGRGRWRRLEDVSPWVPLAFIAIEDHRFADHPGVDWRGVARAVVENVRAGRVVAGGSTLTQQVVKHVLPQPRTLSGKLMEAIWALRLERAHSKQEILTEYVNRVPFGHNTFGIEAAARLYLGKGAKALSLAEAALLAGIPRAPSMNNPLTDPEQARRRQRVVLDRMRALSLIDEAAWREAKAEVIVLDGARRRLKAPHFAAWIARRELPPGTHRTTLDLETQATVEALVKAQLRQLADQRVSQGAAVVLDNATGDLLAWVGSADFFDRDEGQVDMVIRRRQPGSTLKPFVYGLAFEGDLRPTTPIPDLPIYFSTPTGGWSPRNYDRKYHGWIYPRQALACSYNVPAVWAAERVGIAALLGHLRALGISGLDQPAGVYGLGLALGNAEISLLDLANAYRTLANEGVSSPPRWRLGEDRPRGRRVMKGATARLLIDMLSDPIARAPAFGRGGPLETPYPAAAKTGTSADFTDAWTVGFTSEITVAVWVGNFDGAPMDKVSGGLGAAPLWRQIMDALSARRRPRPFSRAGLRAEPLCARARPDPTAPCEAEGLEWVITARGQAPEPETPEPQAPDPQRRRAERPLQVLQPQAGDVFVLDPDVPAEFGLLALRARLSGSQVSGVQSPDPSRLRLQWRVDGAPVGEPVAPGAPAWWPPTAGRHTAQVIALDASGAAVAESLAVGFSVSAPGDDLSSPTDARQEAAP